MDNNNSVSTMQVITSFAVQATGMSIMTSAVGVMLATMTPMALSGAEVGDSAIQDLRRTFGATIVNEAIKNVGKGDVTILAGEVERLYIEMLEDRYGKWYTNIAINNAIPGNLKSVRAIAYTLKEKGIKSTSTQAQIDAALGLGKKRRKAQPVVDTRTGIKYGSKSSAGMAVAAEYGLDPTETYVWYEVLKKDPKRFRVL